MCGIVGYAGEKQAAPFLIEGLKKLEYRGYDSFGFATLDSNGGAYGHKDLGSVVAGARGDNYPFELTGRVGIGHTRWATHGKVETKNTHPIEAGQVSVVHNGIISNYKELKWAYEAYGCKFYTDTDTEVIAQVLNNELAARTHKVKKERLIYALQATVSQLKGQYAFAVLWRDAPELLGFVSNGSPLVFGVGGYLASDPIAFQGFETNFRRVPDKTVGIFESRHIWPQICGIDSSPVELPKPEAVPEEPEFTIEGGHAMLSEILEQPRILSEIHEQIPSTDFGDARQLVLFGCGSSYNAALIGRYYFENIALIPTQVEYASEMTRRKMILYKEQTTFVGITQSGETKDTVDALKWCHDQRDAVWCITNNPKSTAGGHVDDSQRLCLGCGPEVGVAATKTFTETVSSLLHFALSCCSHQATWLQQESLHGSLPAKVKDVIDSSEGIADIAKAIAKYEHALYLARGIHYGTALEGALKLKEVSYIHAEAIHAGEMKHGPIALIDDKTVSVFIVTQDGETTEKVLANMNEIRARNGKVLVVHDQASSEAVRGLADWSISVSDASIYLQPIIVSVALQLLAYYAAVERGINPDRPRNLAKSVTVE